MILFIYNTKPTRLHYTIVLIIIPINQGKEFVYNTAITQLIPSSFLRESIEVNKSKLINITQTISGSNPPAPFFINEFNAELNHNGRDPPTLFL